MCQICFIEVGGDRPSFKPAARDFYQSLAALLSSKEGTDDLRQFYIKILRDTADEIEANMKASKVIAEALTEAQLELNKKTLRIEVLLLAEESQFYTNYGMVMPEEVRASLRARHWDALEQTS